jgi:phytoene dehydrogenase-like protein
LLMVRFALKALRSAKGLADAHFRTRHARGLFAGIAAHAILPLDRPASASFGLMLAVAAHADGWPIVRGGSQKLADALASYFLSLGGVIETAAPVRSLHELPPASAVLCDVTPRQFMRLADDRLPAGYRRRLERFRHGPGAFKLDYAMKSPTPWKAGELLNCGTVHLGGTFERNATSGTGESHSGHMSWLCNRRFLIQLVHRPANRRSGPTATFPTDRAST